MSWWSDLTDALLAVSPGGTLTPGGQAAIGGAVQGSGVLGGILGIWANLRDYKMWRSLGWLLLGIVLMLLGAAWWLGPSAARAAPTSVVARGLA
jgi:hypothetical protein